MLIVTPKVIWLISGDIQFVPPSRKGYKPQYNYPEIFQKFEALLYRKRTNPIMITLFDELDREIFGTVPAALDTTPDVIEDDEQAEVLARNRGIEAAFDAPPASRSIPQIPSASHDGTPAAASHHARANSPPSVSSGSMQSGPSTSISSRFDAHAARPIESTPLSPTSPPPEPSIPPTLETQEPTQPVVPARTKRAKKKPAAAATDPSVDATVTAPAIGTSRPRRTGLRRP